MGGCIFGVNYYYITVALLYLGAEFIIRFEYEALVLFSVLFNILWSSS